MGNERNLDVTQDIRRAAGRCPISTTAVRGHARRFLLHAWHRADALRKAGDRRVTTAHLATDHAYSDMRIELSKTVLGWLGGLAQ